MQKLHAPFKKVPTPMRAGASAWKLLDDGIWNALNKPADKLSEKTGYSKAATASSALFIGWAASDIQESAGRNDLAYLARNITISAVVAKIMHWVTRHSGSSSAGKSDWQAVDFGDAVKRAIRLPIVLIGTGIAFADFSIGLVCVSYGVFCYLLSSSNGMGKKALDWAKGVAGAAAGMVKGALSPTPAQAMVPVSPDAVRAEN